MNKLNLTGIVFGVVVLAFGSMTFSVDEREKAIKFSLGKIESTDFDPGLHFKLPLVNNVKKFSAQIQMLDERADKYITKEKKQVLVDSFVKWRISNVEKFYTSTSGDFNRANTRIAQVVRDSLRGAFGKRTEIEAISGDRIEIIGSILPQISKQIENFGIKIIDVRIKRVDLPPEISRSVFERMDSERERVAKELRSKGNEASEKIKAEADRQRTVILANAIKLSEEVRGEGDAKATEIYAKAYGRDVKFYDFYRSLEAYRNTFSGDGNLMVLSPDSEFFNYFNKAK